MMVTYLYQLICLFHGWNQCFDTLIEWKGIWLVNGWSIYLQRLSVGVPVKPLVTLEMKVI